MKCLDANGAFVIVDQHTLSQVLFVSFSRLTRLLARPNKSRFNLVCGKSFVSPLISKESLYIFIQNNDVTHQFHCGQNGEAGHLR